MIRDSASSLILIKASLAILCPQPLDAKSVSRDDKPSTFDAFADRVESLGFPPTQIEGFARYEPWRRPTMLGSLAGGSSVEKLLARQENELLVGCSACAPSTPDSRKS
jgi:hypothetical protein